MPESIVLILIPERTQDDLMLWQAVARALTSTSRSIVIVPALAEYAERVLEAEGIEVSREAGRIVTGPDEGDVLLRASREQVRAAASSLTEEGISAVAFSGTDRGLLKRRHGSIEASNADWLRVVARSGVVTIVAPVAVADAAEAVDCGWMEVGMALARPGDTVFVLSAGPGSGGSVESMPKAGGRLAQAEKQGVSVRETTLSQLAADLA